MNMEDDSPKRRSTPWSGKFFSARFFFARAGAIVVLFLLAHFMGLREYTTFLSGTTGSEEVSFRASAFYGTTYLVFYMGCVVVAPIFIIAAGLLVIWEHRSRLSRNERT